MKNICYVILGMVVTFVSCVSLQDREMSGQERTEANIVGSVSTSFNTFRFLHFIGNNSIRNKAHAELMRIARAEHGPTANIEIRNIQITGSGSIWQAVYVGGSLIPSIATFPIGINLGTVVGLPHKV